MSVAQQAVRGTIYILFSSYANMGMGVLYSILLARLLAPEHFGIYAGAMFFATAFDIRSKLGLDYAFIHKQPTTPELLATHWLLQISLSTITLVILTITAIIIAQLNYPTATAPLIIALGISLLVEATGTTARAALEKELSFGYSTIVISLALGLSYIGALIGAYNGLTYWALFLQTAINTLLNVIGFWWVYRKLSNTHWRWRLEPAITHWLLRFGATMTVASIATTILLQFDNFLVLTFVGSAAAGYYVQAYKIAQWPTGLVTHVVSRVSLPTYAQLQNDLPRLGKAFEMSLWLILMLAVPFALAIFITAPDFIELLYGANWLPAVTPLRFLIGYSVLRPLLDDTGALFTALGRPDRVNWVIGIQAITLVIFAPPLTLWFGSTGTAISVGFAFFIGIATAYTLITNTVNSNIWRLFVPTVTALAFTGLLYISVASSFNSLPWIWVRVLVKIGLIIPCFLVISGALQYHELLERLRLVWRLLRPTSSRVN